MANGIGKYVKFRSPGDWFKSNNLSVNQPTGHAVWKSHAIPLWRVMMKENLSFSQSVSQPIKTYTCTGTMRTCMHTYISKIQCIYLYSSTQFIWLCDPHIFFAYRYVPWHWRHAVQGWKVQMGVRRSKRTTGNEPAHDFSFLFFFLFSRRLLPSFQVSYLSYKLYPPGTYWQITCLKRKNVDCFRFLPCKLCWSIPFQSRRARCARIPHSSFTCCATA